MPHVRTILLSVVAAIPLHVEASRGDPPPVALTDWKDVFATRPELLKPGFLAAYYHGRLAANLELILGTAEGRALTSKLLAGSYMAS